MIKPTKRPLKTKRMRRHGDAPANWQWRARPDGSGRPRWIPSPSLRAAGWKALDLKDDQGGFLTEGLSRDRAREINAAVDAWRRGDDVGAQYAAIAPIGAHVAPGGPVVLPQAKDRLSIGKLIDAYQASVEFAGAVDAKGVRTGGLAPQTQKNYRLALKRLVDALAGYAKQPAKDDAAAQAAYALAFAQVRAMSATVLAPVERRDGMVRILNTAYWALHGAAGQHQAYYVLAATSAWLKWCQRNQSSSIRQAWAADVSRETPPGRIRPWTVDEFRIMVATADAMGWRSIGDSIVLGLDLSWSQTDRLSLTWNRLKNDRAFTGAAGRKKTGRVGGTPLTSLGRDRVKQIAARQADMDAHPTHVLWCETTNKPWHKKSYGERFAEIRAEAGKQCPSLLDDDATGHKGAWDADLRDTAFTWMKNAGLDDAGIASRTIQGLKHIADLSDNNYGEIGPEIADPAGRKYEAYLKKIGATA